MSKQDFSTYKVLRRHGGFYYCEHPEGGEIECKLKGSFKKGRRTTNLVVVGDHVKLDFFRVKNSKLYYWKSVNVIP